jgi:hypothetical protein
MLEYDLEGIVAKRKSDPYRRGVHWWKIKNPAYTQAEGRHELFTRAASGCAVCPDLPKVLVRRRH